MTVSSFVRCVFKALLPVVVFLSSLKAEQCSRKLLFLQVTKGDRLTSNVISSHDVASSMDCGQQCLQQVICVAFNYRSKPKKSNETNCQLTNNTEGFEENGAKNNVGIWIFYKALDAPPCSKNPCKNGGVCVSNVCQPESFSCKCGIQHMGKLCEVDKVFKSCQEALDVRNSSAAQNGVYKIKTETASGFTNVYCQMTLLTGCSGGGWTMVMKINGAKDTFNYSSTYWSDKLSYNLSGGVSAFDDQETKLPTYWSTSFNEMCIGMKVENDLNFVRFRYPASSLYNLIAAGNYRQINIGRQKWKSLITGSSLQSNCNKEGFNAPSPNVRLGILGNNENDCSNPDSFLGFGGPVTNRNIQGLLFSNTAGNFAVYSPDNGNKNTHAMGYILVR